MSSAKRKYFLEELPMMGITFGGKHCLLYNINDPERLTTEARSLDEAYSNIIDSCYGDYLKKVFDKEWILAKNEIKEIFVKRGIKPKSI